MGDRTEYQREYRRKQRAAQRAAQEAAGIIKRPGRPPSQIAKVAISAWVEPEVAAWVAEQGGLKAILERARSNAS